MASVRAGGYAQGQVPRLLTTMRIATWNLNRPARDGKRKRALLEYIREVAADVWVLTESHIGFAPGPEYRLVASSSRAPDRGPGEMWTAIWTRCDAGSALATSEPERTACVEVDARDGASVLVYGTVLPWSGDHRRAPLRGAAAFCAALEEQARDWSRLRSAYPHATLCVAGDFNQDLARKHYYGSRIGRERLTHTLKKTSLTCWTGGERDPIPASTGHASIDHICIDARREPRSSARVWPRPDAVGAHLTDHFGVAIDL